MNSMAIRAGVFLASASIFFNSSLAAAQTCSNLVPELTGDSLAVSSSGEISASFPAWQAFDGVSSTMWISDTFETPAWIAYEFDYPTFVDSYSINYANGGITTRAPKEFELQGSSDGDEWVTLDTETNQTDWGGSETRTFAVDSPGAYTQYRLLVTDDNDSREGVVVISIGEFSLENCGCNFSSEQVPVLTGDSSAVSASGSFNRNTPAWLAFDDSLSTQWLSAVFETPASIGYEWTEPRFIDQYSIRYSNGSILSRAPKDWKLQGWDGRQWITVDTRSEQTDWSGSETRHYTVQSPGSYSEYRLFIDDDNDIRDGIVVISLGNLSLRGCEK